MAESWELKAVRDRLRAPFPREQIGRLPATPKRPALDYVGHAAVTDRLNSIAPDWSYTIDEKIAFDGGYWIEGTMTIGGVSRPEFGDGPDPKQALGNFIRRAAMRFGVALDLWSREELESSPAAGPAVTPKAGAATTEPAEAPQAGGTTSASSGEVGADAEPEGGTSSASRKPSSGFPIDAAVCDHKTAAGKWVKWRLFFEHEDLPDGRFTEKSYDVCPKCGTPKLVAMEGTNADLGPAT